MNKTGGSLRALTLCERLANFRLAWLGLSKLEGGLKILEKILEKIPEICLLVCAAG